jgi:glycine cleavage system aminomethyltransferase T
MGKMEFSTGLWLEGASWRLRVKKKNPAVIVLVISMVTPIQNSTKTILTTFATEQGFTVIDNTATKAKDQWVLSCAEDHESSHTITTIRQHMHAGTNIRLSHL